MKNKIECAQAQNLPQEGTKKSMVFSICDIFIVPHENAHAKHIIYKSGGLRLKKEGNSHLELEEVM